MSEAARHERRPILVVDDDPDVVVLVRRVLEASGWIVEGTTDSREALRMVQARRPCLLIVDLMMPHLDGEDLVAAVRAGLPASEQPRIAIVSAAYARADVARRLGVDASLEKPFNLDDLQDLAVRFASGHRRRPGSGPPSAR